MVDTNMRATKMDDGVKILEGGNEDKEVGQKIAGQI